ncbi:hypothetical protein QU516_15410 (plasmid) [Moellerella wisconsensis]|uniref:hypothetical protein n=1 Tax=Morganellaceae TaxID=1903414 RepID=UPI0010BE9A50|nr:MULTISPECIES: hypothetical protein [Morganellaceae]QCJ72128.1 hypothetical protein C9446_20180 [Providencia heimbachae]WJW83609.1 hypothetical protein QU516_15410 [Moellerella wisconsensis]
MRFITSIIYLSLGLVSFPSMAIDGIDDDGTMPATYSGDLFQCRLELIKLIASSNHALIQSERVTSDKLDIFIENREGDELMIQLSDKSQKPSNESPGAGQLGWVSYDLKKNRLQSMSTEETLTFSPAQGQRLQSCLRKEEECHQILNTIRLEAFIPQSPKWRVIGKGRAYFHAAPTEQCHNNNWFVVPGDILQVNGMRATKPIGGDNNGWLLVAYGDANGWVNINRLEPVDEPAE